MGCTPSLQRGENHQSTTTTTGSISSNNLVGSNECGDAEEPVNVNVTSCLRHDGCGPTTSANNDESDSQVSAAHSRLDVSALPVVASDTPSRELLPVVNINDDGQGQSIFLYDDGRFDSSINGRNGFTLDQIYEEGPTHSILGEGHFGCVYRRYHAFQGTHVAIKRTRPTALDLRAGPIQSYKDLLEKCQEVRTLVRLKHSLANDAPVTRGNDPSDDQQQKFPIMQLYEFFWNGKDLHLVLELMYVNFREWILQQVSFSEEQAKEAAKSILTGLKILNDHNIVHRDIKEDNIMFRLQNDLRTLTICDFGFAQDLSLSSKEKSSSFSNTTTGLCGSLGYLAPEIYMGVPYGTSVDLFSFGVLLFRILSAEKPWPEVPREATESATIHLQYIVDDGHPQWQTVSKHGKALVRRLLQYSKDRITAVDALGHQWFGERSMSILQTNPSTAYFPGARARKTSQAIIEDSPEHDFDGRCKGSQGPRYWIHQRMKKEMSCLSATKAFYGQMAECLDDYILVEEFTIQHQAVLLPTFVASLPGPFSELECRRLFRQIVLRVDMFHKEGLVHRNIQPSSFVVETDTGDDGFHVYARGINFVSIFRNENLSNPCFSQPMKAARWVAFTAPELDLIECRDDFRMDLWSLGVLLYFLLCGVGPFVGTQPAILYQKSVGLFEFKIVEPSLNAQDLVKSLLRVDPSERLTVDKILDHTWMTAPDSVLQDLKLDLTKTLFGDWGRKLR